MQGPFPRNGKSRNHRERYLRIQLRIDQLRAYIRWHVEDRQKLTGPYLLRIESKIFVARSTNACILGRLDFLVLPVSQVLPFDVAYDYPTGVAGTKRDNYLSWAKSACYIMTIGNPAALVPCAFFYEEYFSMGMDDCRGY